MEKEVMVLPLPPPIDFNFNFNTNCSSPPYLTAPSSPQQDFEFNFNSQLQRPSLSADQLFHAGKILPLNLISPSQFSHSNSNSIHQQSHEEEEEEDDDDDDDDDEAQQQNKLVGRERSSSFSKISMSTCDSKKYFKISESEKSETSSSSASTFSTFLSSISFSKGYRKWRFKDFLLFRSASEGRAIERDPLRRKYTVLSKTTPYEDVVVGNSSFRSIENSGSVSKRRGPVSAHELHYKLNRAASEELKRKTMLPYKQGLLGCLGFNHGMDYHISGRFGSF